MRLFSSLFVQSIAITCMMLINAALYSAPWFTGPLLATPGHTMPNGHTNFEIYALDVGTNGAYNQNGVVVRAPLFRSFIANPVFTHGFTDWLDVQVMLPYFYNKTQRVSSNGLSDVSVATGIQLFEQKEALDRIDLRLVLQETFPTGRYDHLNPNLLGTDATGLGAYQSLVAFNFQHLLPLFKTHYLRTRLIVSRIFKSSLWVDGFNTYGGTLNTHGKVRLGSENDVDLAFEYTLTQNWVAVMEGYIAQGDSSNFSGTVDIGSPSTSIIGKGAFMERGLAPAIEYNFNRNVGIIGGVWFPVSGKNTPHFLAYVMALNAFW